MKRALLLLLLLSIAVMGNAHVLNYELDKMSGDVVIGKYLLTGFQHIIPLGFDHILFIICVFFINADLKKVILQATMFTIAHSVTLGLAMYGVISPSPAVVEPLIALSIVLLAIENMVYDKVKPWRMIMVFIFGMVHGMGFAGALAEMGLPSYAFATALISFNVGVELGQLCIILSLYLLVSRQFSQRTWYRRGIVVPASLSIALIAGWWTIERIFFS